MSGFNVTAADEVARWLSYHRDVSPRTGWLHNQLVAYVDALTDWGASPVPKEYEGGPYVVVRTATHGGGIVSRHRSLVRAYEWVWRNRSTSGCECGCAGVVPESMYDTLPECGAATPTQLARR